MFGIKSFFSLFYFRSLDEMQRQKKERIQKWNEIGAGLFIEQGCDGQREKNVFFSLSRPLKFNETICAYGSRQSKSTKKFADREEKNLLAIDSLISCMNRVYIHIHIQSECVIQWQKDKMLTKKSVYMRIYIYLPCRDDLFNDLETTIRDGRTYIITSIYHDYYIIFDIFLQFGAIVINYGGHCYLGCDNCIK